MKELTILMCWHDDNNPDVRAAYLENKRSFIENNPNIELITILNRFQSKSKAWLSSDLNIFHWYLNAGSRSNSERFLLVEWDCWCNCELKSYYSKVWNCDVVAPSVYYPERDHWNWFSSISRLPVEVQKYATGIVPFTGILLSSQAMSQISKLILKPQFDDFNSELRLATIASFLKMDPVVNPVSNRSISWKEQPNMDFSQRLLYHPVKRCNRVVNFTGEDYNAVE